MNAKSRDQNLVDNGNPTNSLVNKLKGSKSQTKGSSSTNKRKAVTTEPNNNTILSNVSEQLTNRAESSKQRTIFLSNNLPSSDTLRVGTRREGDSPEPRRNSDDANGGNVLRMDGNSTSLNLMGIGGHSMSSGRRSDDQVSQTNDVLSQPKRSAKDTMPDSIQQLIRKDLEPTILPPISTHESSSESIVNPSTDPLRVGSKRKGGGFHAFRGRGGIRTLCQSISRVGVCTCSIC